MHADEASVAASQRATGRPAWLRVAAGLFLAGASALLLTLAFPPYGLWPLIWLGFVPMLVAQHRLLPARLSSLAPAIAIGGWLGVYILSAFASYSTYMNALPLAIGAIVLLTNQGDRAFHARTGYRWFVVQGALGWAGLEMVRGFIPIMGTWGFVAYALHGQPWLIQPVSACGVIGLGLLVMLANYALALAALAVYDHRQPAAGPARPGPRLASRWLAVAGVALAAWVGWSLFLYERPAAAPTATVAAVQVQGRAANNRSYEKDPQVRAQRFAQLVQGSREAAARGAELIVWPEGALSFDPQVERTAELRALSAETGAYLVIGYFVDRPDGTWRNEATVLAPSGEFLGNYGKAHPVVFGGERNTSLGTFPVYDTPAGHLGTIICYDLDFTGTARVVARSGAQVVAVPSLDFPGIAHRHYGHLVFRAVENRVAMVKADGGYDSAIVDPYGRVVARAVTPGGAPSLLVAEVALGSGGTLATRLGDWAGWLGLAGLVAFMVTAPVTMRRPARAS